VHEVSAVDMEFLANQEEAESRNASRGNVPIAQLAKHCKTDQEKEELRNVSREDVPIAQLTKHRTLNQKHGCNANLLSNEARRGAVLRKNVPIAQSVERKKRSRSPKLMPGGQSQWKRECLVSIFFDVHPFWQGDPLLYKFRLQNMGKQYEYGIYDDENLAALARDYATRQIVSLTGSKSRDLNTSQFFLEDDVEKERIDRWLEKILSGPRFQQRQLHGVTQDLRTGEYRVWLSVAGNRIDFGAFRDEEYAELVSDYISRYLLSEQAHNFPDKQLLGNAELKTKLRRLYSEAILSASSGASTVEEFYIAKEEFWEAIRDGPVFIFSSCHQTWFKKSVKLIIDGLLAKTVQGRCASAITDVSDWVCGMCYRYLFKGKVPRICHLKNEPFKDLPEELQSLSAVDNNLIALRLPFMKIRALDPSVRGGPRKFGQLCLRGMVINVPTDLSHIQLQLPRQFSADDTLVVNLKRRLQSRRFYERENVRPYKILKALQFLTTHKTLWREAGVNLCPEFAAALGSVVQEERSLPMESVEISSLCEEEIAHSDRDESSEDEAADAHAFEDETLVDDGVADPEVRDEIINVASGDDQHPLCLYLDKNAEEMANPDIFGGSARPTN
jgi:hypothetical protein